MEDLLYYNRFGWYHGTVTGLSPCICRGQFLNNFKQIDLTTNFSDDKKDIGDGLIIRSTKKYINYSGYLLFKKKIFVREISCKGDLFEII